ncbi:MAG: dioxygenase, partial [Alphaproteobacteria bacterium]|nr:dioxygenase [Alphaproteobacteria bacterium]
AMAFYKDVAGLEEVYVRPPVKAGFLSNGNTHHDVGLVDFHGPAGWRKEAGLNHVGLELENEVDLVRGYEKLLADKVPIDRTGNHDIAHAVYIRDPDRNQIEIYSDTTKDWRNRRQGTVMAPTMKWYPGATPPTTEPLYVADPELHRVEAAIFHPRKVTHVVMVASDYAGCVRHYTDIVGFRVMLGGADAPFSVLGGTCDERSLSIFRAGPNRPPGLHHVGFPVWDEDDLTKSAARLGAAGLTAEIELNHATRRCIHLRDPDGIRLQFYVDRAGPLDMLTGVGEDVALYLA